MTQLFLEQFTSATELVSYDYSPNWKLFPASTSYAYIKDSAYTKSAPAYPYHYNDSASATPPTANYSVSADVIARTIVSGNAAGVAARVNPGSSKSYTFMIHSNGNLTLTTEPWATIGTATMSVVAGNTYRAKIVVDGDQISAYVDDVLKIGPVTHTTNTVAGYPGFSVWADSSGTSATTGMAIDNLSLDTLAGGSPDASAEGGTGTVTITATGGEATGGSSGTDIVADGGTGTIVITGSGGDASTTSTGSFVTDVMENNTGAGALASTAIVWTWYQGSIGSAPTSTTHGTGTTNSLGVITASGLPAGAGFLLVRTNDSSGVYYQPGTVT